MMNEYDDVMKEKYPFIASSSYIIEYWVGRVGCQDQGSLQELFELGGLLLVGSIFY